MGDAQTHYAAWLDLVAELGRHHLGPFPRSLIAERLHESFHCQVSWNWMNADGWFGWEVRDPLRTFPPPGDEGASMVAEGLRSHPLVCWYALTGDPTPTTVGRVPRALVPAEGFRLLHELLGPEDAEQQLAIPYVLGPGTYRTFVLGQGRTDFTDEEVCLAQRLQPLLAVLDRQSRVLAERPPTCDAAGLTAREVAVLVLLAEGLTAVAIAHRLVVSTRTVHAHLRSIYRKLGVADRLRAVLEAQDRGIIPAVPSSGARPTDSGAPLAQQWVSPRRFRPQAAGSPRFFGRPEGRIATKEPGTTQHA